MKHLFFTLILALSPLAFAEEDYVIHKEKEAIAEDSSAFHRINKQYEVGALLFGIGPSLLNTQGLYFAHKLDRNSSILIEATSGRGATVSLSGDNYDITGKSIGAHYKRFSGNSFYWRAGIDYRTIKYSHTYQSITSYENSEFDGQSLAANFQIGNQWQWENFTLGCDWVGLSAPLTSSVSNESVRVSGGGNFSNEQKWARDDQAVLLKDTHFNLLRFYLGWAF